MKKHSLLRVLGIGVYTALLWGGLGTFSAQAQTIQLTPVSNEVAPNSSFSLRMTGDSAGQDLFGMGGNLTFDPALLTFVSATEGDFLKQDCPTMLVAQESTPGVIAFVQTRLGITCKGVNGSGHLLTFTFKSKEAAGKADLTFSGTSVCILSTPGEDCAKPAATWTNAAVTIASAQPAPDPAQERPLYDLEGNVVGTIRPSPNAQNGQPPVPAPAPTVLYTAPAEHVAQAPVGGGGGGGGGDYTPPVMTGVQLNSVGPRTAVIAWTTHESAYSQLEYGLTTNYGTITNQSVSLSINQYQVLVDLIPNTTYHFRAISRDASGNLAYSGDYSFTTTAPIIAQSQHAGTIVLQPLSATGTTSAATTTPIPPSSQKKKSLLSILVEPIMATLRGGMQGASVQNLQNFLLREEYLSNAQLISERGRYGDNTQRAVQLFQKEKGLPETGLVDQTTVEAMNASLQEEQSEEEADANAFFLGPQFDRPLAVGSRGDDVRLLQIFLNIKGFPVAVSGVGSRGLESEYFGQATARALARFQEKYASEVLAPFGLTRGTGFFGEATMKKVNELNS